MAERHARFMRRAGSAKARPRERRFDVVGLGALNLDHLYAVPQLIQDGGVEVLRSSAQAGGSAANTIYALAKLGLRCGFVGVVGDDDAGKALVASFEEVGVDTSGILAEPGATTGQTICITAGQRQKAIYIVPGANNLLDTDKIDLSYLTNASWVHISSFVGDDAFSQQSRMVANLPPRTKLSFALDALYARRGLEAVGPLIGRCSVLFANDHELEQLAGENLPAAAHACVRLGCETVVVTFGAGKRQGRGRGVAASSIFTGQKTERGPELIEHTVPAPMTRDGPIEDTTGAGDAFAAGFLFGLLQGKYSLPMCGALGHTAAGFSLGALGARIALPTRQEFLARFERHFGSLFADELRSRALGPLRAG